MGTFLEDEKCRQMRCSSALHLFILFILSIFGTEKGQDQQDVQDGTSREQMRGRASASGLSAIRFFLLAIEEFARGRGETIRRCAQESLPIIGQIEQ
jgi:hypothetical protein